MIKRLIIALQILFFTGNLYVNCMPAYPKKIPVKVGDGVVYINLYGDEHNKKAESLDGYTIIQKNGIWYFAERDSEEWLKPSTHKLSANLSEATKQFLNNIPRHLAIGSKNRQTNRSISKTHRIKHTKTVIGSRRILVILMQFNDMSMVKSLQEFNALFNEKGYSVDGAIGSVCDFYTDVSYGQLQLVCDIIGPFTSKYGRAYYGGNDRSGNDNHPEELFEEAVKNAVEQVNLNDYDVDKDGYVDNVHIIFAGHAEDAGASDEAIWSHEATFYQPYVIQGMKIDQYSCAPELRGNNGKGISRIGPHCHEIGHALGAMDYYDTDYGIDGEYFGTGDWDVMASGSWNNDGIAPADFNPYVKAYDFGWVTPKELPSGNVTIHPSYCGTDNYFILRSPYSADYYLLENRNKEKWGNGVPGEGLLLFHIHPEIIDSENGINSKAPQKCYLVCASSTTRRPGNTPSSYGNINSNGCPYPGKSNNRNFGQSSIPVAFFWDDVECGIELNNISIVTSGDIHLDNNGMAVDNTERERLFFEGFEDNHVSIDIITDDKNSLLPTWVVESNPNNPSKFIQRPSAYQGLKSLQLSAKNVSDKVTSLFSFNIPEVEEKDRGGLRLKFFAYTLNPQADNHNSLLIFYRTKDLDEWQYIEVQSIVGNYWRQFTIELPRNIFPQIKVKGTAHMGSVLAIDNLEVELFIENNETGYHDAQLYVNRNMSFYTLSGIRQGYCQKGINIIRDSNGKTYKIFVK